MLALPTHAASPLSNPGSYGFSLRDLTGSYGFLRVLTGSYGFLAGSVAFPAARGARCLAVTVSGRRAAPGAGRRGYHLRGRPGLQRFHTAVRGPDGGEEGRTFFCSQVPGPCRPLLSKHAMHHSMARKMQLFMVTLSCLFGGPGT